MNYNSTLCLFLIGHFIFERILDYRQYQRFSIRSPPKQLEHLIDEKTFLKSQRYNAKKMRFGVLQSLIDLVEELGFFYFNVYALIWNSCRDFLNLDEQSQQILIAFGFSALLMLYSTLRSLPFSAYQTFVIEAEFEFNKTTLSTFILDIVKSLALSSIIGAPVLAGVLFVIEWAGSNFYLYLWTLLFLIQLVLVSIYPIFIAPIFNKFEPLEEGSLRHDITELCKRVHFPLTKLYVVDGSRRSAHSNAYFYGFFSNKRIVLYDTLLKGQGKMSNQQILSILCHELGHWQYMHPLLLFVIQNLYTLAFVYVFNFFLHQQALYTSFGFSTSPTFIGLLLFSNIFSPLSHLFSLVINGIVRQLEYQADRYAKSLGFKLGSGLVKIHLKNLANLVPDRFYSLYHYNHPTLVERLQALGETGEAIKQEQNEYEKQENQQEENQQEENQQKNQ